MNSLAIILKTLNLLILFTKKPLINGSLVIELYFVFGLFKATHKKKYIKYCCVYKVHCCPNSLRYFSVLAAWMIPSPCHPCPQVV